MGWASALAVIVLLAILPLGVSARYDEAGPVIRLILGPVRLQVFPGRKKNPPREKKPKQKKKPAQTQTKSGKTQSKGGKLSDFLPIVQTLLDFLWDFRRKIRVDVLELKLTMAGDDPCDLAVNYGRTWAALGNLEPQLDRLFIIKKKDMQVQCDFEADDTRILARLDLTITLGRILALAVVYAIRALKEFLNIKKKRKGGAAK